MVRSPCRPGSITCRAAGAKAVAGRDHPWETLRIALRAWSLLYGALVRRFTWTPRPRTAASSAPAIGTPTTARPGARRRARRHRTCATAVVQTTKYPAEGVLHDFA